MTPEPFELFYDYVSPESYLVHLMITGVIDGAAGDLTNAVRRAPFELAPPPASLTSPNDSIWRTAWASVPMAFRGETLRATDPPRFIPWTRKAHELGLLADSKGCFAAVHKALFRAFFLDGKDIGRVDVLVRIGQSVDLDPSEVKATLDVDRFTSDIAEAREEAISGGITSPATLRIGDRLLVPPFSVEEVREFLVHL